MQFTGRSRAFNGLLVTHFCYNYQYYLALSLGPDFFYTHFNVDISKPSSGIGFYACLPYILLFAVINVAGWLADALHTGSWCGLHRRQQKQQRADPDAMLGNDGVTTLLLNDHDNDDDGPAGGGVSMTIVRKACNTVGLLGCAIFFGLLGSHSIQHGGTDKTALYRAVGLLTAGVGLGGFASGAGYWCNYHDLSAKYSPHIMGIGNSIATIPGILGNLVSGVILEEIHGKSDGGAAAWMDVFTITAAVASVGALTFLLTASGEQIVFEKRKRRSGG